GGNLADPQVEQLFLDALDGGVDLLGADRALAQGQGERGAQLGRHVVHAPAVLLHHRRKADLRPLVGGEALFTVAALTPAANEVRVLGYPGLNDLGFQMTAERALHSCRPKESGVGPPQAGFAPPRGAATRAAAERGGIICRPGSAPSAR